MDILIPFIVKHLLLHFTKCNKYDFSFIYILYHNGIISKETIQEKISLIWNTLIDSDNYMSKEHIEKDNCLIWFLPEIIEMNFFYKFYPVYFKVKKFIRSFYPDNIDKYKEMRNYGKPNDILTNALRNDDIDSLQLLISKKLIDVTVEKVPFYIFEVFVPNGLTNFIDYAAAYGSVKCFKYLLLNHCSIDLNTYKMAVFGGNVEIIKIVDQKANELDLFSDTELNNFIKNDSKLIDIIIPAIIKHRNDIFDWIFEKNLLIKN